MLKKGVTNETSKLYFNKISAIIDSPSTAQKGVSNKTKLYFTLVTIVIVAVKTSAPNQGNQPKSYL
jgi:hypothetical protein